jgi:hypothetical protein
LTIQHKWEFNASHNAKDYGLTAEHCDIAFPGLFNEIDRAIAYRKKIGMIALEEIDIAWKDTGVVRGLIYDQQVAITRVNYVYFKLIDPSSTALHPRSENQRQYLPFHSWPSNPPRSQPRNHHVA